MRTRHKIKHHCRRAKQALSDAIEGVTNPPAFATAEGQMAERPNYQLVGHKAVHVYGYPDQGPDVRVASNKGDARRAERNNMLHYSEREYKPMTMERKFRRF